MRLASCLLTSVLTSVVWHAIPVNGENYLWAAASGTDAVSGAGGSDNGLPKHTSESGIASQVSPEAKALRMFSAPTPSPMPAPTFPPMQAIERGSYLGASESTGALKDTLKEDEAYWYRLLQEMSLSVVPTLPPPTPTPLTPTPPMPTHKPIPPPGKGKGSKKPKSKAKGVPKGPKGKGSKGPKSYGGKGGPKGPKGKGGSKGPKGKGEGYPPTYPKPTPGSVPSSPTSPSPTPEAAGGVGQELPQPPTGAPTGPAILTEDVPLSTDYDVGP